MVSMDFLYVVLPALIALAGILVAWLVIRRYRSLRTSAHSTARKTFERLALSSIAIVALALAASSAINAILLHHARAAMPGRLYLVDGHRMRLDCTGQGSPTLVLDAGLGNDGLVWSGVQPVLSRTTRVCSYDRAGMGWSNPVPPPRDADHIADQLHSLLAVAGINGPIVLMGHSIAGMYIRAYAARYPAQVAGLIFVDASTPWQNRDPALQSEMHLSHPPRLRIALVQATLVLGFPRWSGGCSHGFPGLAPALSRLSAENRCHLLVLSPVGEMLVFDQSGAETVHTTFGNLPILVLSSDPARTLADHRPQAMVDAWERMQANLARLSTRGRRIIAKGSPHYIQLVRPDLIEKEVPLFIEQIRGTAPQPSNYGSTTVE